MPNQQLSVLLENTYSLPAELDREISGMTQDSTQVQEGDLYFACKGGKLDGREFISDAITKGAVAVLAESDSSEVVFLKNIPVIPVNNLKHSINPIAAIFYGHPAKALCLIGVTGTNGKTSCTYFIAAALQQLNIPCGIIGTLGSGMYGNIIPSKWTTPDPIALQETLARLVESGASVVAMEVSSHGIDQGRIEGIEFETAIFTNLTRDHLDYHGDMETYGNVKKRLFENFKVKHSVINADDPFGRSIISSLKSKTDIYAFALEHTSVDVPGVFAHDIQFDETGLHARIETPWGNGTIRVALMGQFNLSNILAVLTTLCLLDIPLADALKSLSQLKSVPGRMEAIGNANEKPLVVVDYSHTPDSLEKALIALRQHISGKLYCVFGCGGDRDKGKRPLMAKIAEQFADVIVVTDDNPRHEDPALIVADIVEGFLRPDEVIIQHDRSKAIQDIIQCAVAGDGILVAGKGAETFQQIGDAKIPLNDGEIVKQYLAHFSSV
jgi:UDP-N-acetylmuramoyl-L-alanyl-D-glutamate--2,6-diaminopimelate ligase